MENHCKDISVQAYEFVPKHPFDLALSDMYYRRLISANDI
jgi:hypothetical protein